MPIKLEIHNAAVSVTSVIYDEDDRGRIPDNLAKLTGTIISMHRANGDLGWVDDALMDESVASASRAMIAEMQAIMANPGMEPIRQLLADHDLLP